MENRVVSLVLAHHNTPTAVPERVGVCHVQAGVMSRELPSRAAWEEEGRMHRRRREAATWALADWLVRGRDCGFDGKGFLSSLAITGYTPAHHYNLERVARAFPPEARSPNLSITAHMMLLREKDPDRRDEFFASAVAGGWPSDRVKKEIAQQRTQPVDPPVNVPTSAPTPTRSGYGTVKVKCPNCEHVFPVRGHKVTP